MRRNKMSNIELSTKYSSKRSFGWSQDASDFNSLKKVVQIFDSESTFHNELIKERIPLLISNIELINKFQNTLKNKPLKITYSDLVGTHLTPRKDSPCNGIIQASIPGQVFSVPHQAGFPHTFHGRADMTYSGFRLPRLVSTENKAYPHLESA